MADGSVVVSRRAWFAGLVSGAGLLAAACGSPGAQVLDTPEGRVLQFEGDNLLVLVSGSQPRYQLGESMHLTLLVNNQSTGYVQVRLRTKLLGRGDQPVVQADPALLSVKSDDASSVDQDLPLPLDLLPGDYTLSIEIPPWKLDGRDFGRGATLQAPIHLDAATSPSTQVVAWRSFLSHLECTACGQRHDADRLQTVCTSCGKVLFARYDLDGVRQAVTPGDFACRRWDMWRYAELLPVRDQTNVVSLGEGLTPLVEVRRSAAHALGYEHGSVLLKDEGQNPTASFKARGLSAAVSRARELGASSIALPSAGNAGAAAAAYAAAAGLTAHVAMPRDVPELNRIEAAIYGAEVTLVDGLISDAGRLIRELAPQHGWFDVSTLKEPYRQEGKKTMGIELAEQGGWGQACLPDVIVYPTGGGTGIVGMRKAFDELEAVGWIGSKRPKMVVVQAEGCAPIVRAYQNGERHAEAWENAQTSAAGLRVPVAIGDYLILDAVRDSGGTAIAVSEDAIRDAQLEMGRLAGVYAAPEAAATWAATAALRRDGFLEGTECIVLFCTGMGIKYPPPHS